MLKINLLPERLRKTAPSSIEQLHRTPLMRMAIAGMVAIPLLLLLPMRMHRLQLQQLTAKIQALEAKRAEVERLQRSVQQLRAQEAAFRGMGKDQGFWSKRLSALSSLTPDGVWFTELNLDQAKGLMIRGAAIGQANPEMANVTRLVRDLEADRDFTSAVKSIQIESIKRVLDGEIEIVQFTLACSTVETPTP